MYKLYWAPDSGAFAVEVALVESGVEFERIAVDFSAQQQHSSEFLAINPKGQVPVLVLPDGSVMTESLAMLLHIADSHPWAGLLPPPGDTDRARVYRWLAFSLCNLYETDLRYYYPERYTDDAAGADGVRTRALASLDESWTQVEETLGAGPFLLDDAFSIADVYLLMLSRWHPRPDELVSRCARLGRLCDATRARPSVNSVWHSHHPE